MLTKEPGWFHHVCLLFLRALQPIELTYHPKNTLVEYFLAHSSHAHNLLKSPSKSLNARFAFRCRRQHEAFINYICLICIHTGPLSFVYQIRLAQTSVDRFEWTERKDPQNGVKTVHPVESVTCWVAWWFQGIIERGIASGTRWFSEVKIIGWRRLTLLRYIFLLTEKLTTFYSSHFYLAVKDACSRWVNKWSHSSSKRAQSLLFSSLIHGKEENRNPGGRVIFWTEWRLRGKTC